MTENQKPSYPPNYPEEYITGSVTFFGREFRVTPDVLIPRLETESLVRRARKILPSGGYDTVVDIGTGSGIIGTSLADLAERVILLDVSPTALHIAESNFRTYYPEKNALFILSDLFSVFLPDEHGTIRQDLQETSKILILANLPYIKAEDWENMSPDTRFEPELALFGGAKTGFELYEILFAQIARLTSLSDYLTMSLIIEFGFDQRDFAERVIRSTGWNYEFFADHAGTERFAQIDISPRDTSPMNL